MPGLLRCVQGGVPKDGPSAGIAMGCALLSHCLGLEVRQGLAMTGELSLTGRVLGIGGLREKVLAAQRAGLSELLLPEENRAHWRDLGEAGRGVTPRFASSFEEVVAVAFDAARLPPGPP